MISPKAVLKYAPFVGAVLAAAFLYIYIQESGWTIGAVLITASLGAGFGLCLVSRPWCKIGAALIGFALVMVAGAVFGFPLFAGAAFIILFWWLR